MVLNIKTAGQPCLNLHQAIFREAHPFFCIIFTTVLRWVPQHLLILQVGNKNFNFVIVSRGSFSFHCPQAEMPHAHSRQRPMTWSWLTNWPTSQWSADQFPQSSLWNSSNVQYWVSAKRLGNTTYLVKHVKLNIGFLGQLSEQEWVIFIIPGMKRKTLRHILTFYLNQCMSTICTSINNNKWIIINNWDFYINHLVTDWNTLTVLSTM